MCLKIAFYFLIDHFKQSNVLGSQKNHLNVAKNLICRKNGRRGRHRQVSLMNLCKKRLASYPLKPMVRIENNLAGMVPRCTSMKLICQKLGRQGHGQFALCTFVRYFSLKPMVRIENNLAGMVTLGHRLSSILTTVKPV